MLQQQQLKQEQQQFCAWRLPRPPRSRNEKLIFATKYPFRLRSGTLRILQWQTRQTAAQAASISRLTWGSETARKWSEVKEVLGVLLFPPAPCLHSNIVSSNKRTVKWLGYNILIFPCPFCAVSAWVRWATTCSIISKHFVLEYSPELYRKTWLTQRDWRMTDNSVTVPLCGQETIWVSSHNNSGPIRSNDSHCTLPYCIDTQRSSPISWEVFHVHLRISIIALRNAAQHFIYITVAKVSSYQVVSIMTYIKGSANHAKLTMSSSCWMRTKSSLLLSLHFQ